MNEQNKMKKTRKIAIFGVVLPVLGFLICGFLLLLEMGTNRYILSIIGGILLIVSIVVGIVLELVFWRCSKCRRLLPFSKFFIEYCPYCGKRFGLRSEEKSNKL